MELLPELVEELGLLLDPRDIGAARATCLSWRNHLSLRVATTPSGGLFELLAHPDINTWQQRVTSLANVFPSLKHLLIYAGGRIGGPVLDAELAALAATVPKLARLELRFLQPAAGSWGSNGSGAGLGPPHLTLPAIPSGLSQMTSLTHLCLVMCGAPTPAEVAHLPTSILELRLASAYDSNGLTDVTMEALGAQLPCLRHLEADIASYTVTAAGLRGLPGRLEELQLHGVLALGADEVLAMCSTLTELQRLTMEVPSDCHEHVVTLMRRHPSLNALELGLNQDEADLDPTLEEVMASLHEIVATSRCSKENVTDPDADHGTGGGSGLSTPRQAQSRQNSQGQGYGSLGAMHGGSPRTSGSVALGSPMSRAASSNRQAPYSPGPKASPPPAPALGAPVPAPATPQLTGLTSLLLQSINIPADTGGVPFLTQLGELTSLTSLSIAEPWVAGGRSTALAGSLTDLCGLTGLRTCLVSLMPGFPIPALHITAEVVRGFAQSCPHLASLTAINSMDSDPACLAALSSLTSLESLMLSPAACPPHRPGPSTGLAPTPLPTLDLLWLPPVSLLSVSSYTLTLTEQEPGQGDLVQERTTVCGGEAWATQEDQQQQQEQEQQGRVEENQRQQPPQQFEGQSEQQSVQQQQQQCEQQLELLQSAQQQQQQQPPQQHGGQPEQQMGQQQQEKQQHQQEQRLPQDQQQPASHNGVDATEPTAATSSPSLIHTLPLSGVDSGNMAQPSSPSLHPGQTLPLPGLSRLEDLVLSHVVLAEGLQPAHHLLRACSGLQSLMLRHVTGLDDELFADEHVQLNKLTSLQVLPAPTVPLTGTEPGLTQAGLAHCSRLTALKRVEWEGWGLSGDGQAEDEAAIITRLAQGARGLHVLRLAPASDPEGRAATARVVEELLPLCCLGAS